MRSIPFPFFGSMLAASFAIVPGPVEASKSDASQSFAVVELFTSEGCSSCPPADRLLSELSDEADRAGRPVYLLAFHVDYWNYLGWADPFSRKEFSQRQERYAGPLGTGGRVYTPQMIVNGEEEFVGSEARTARGRIDAALLPGGKKSRDGRAGRDAAVALTLSLRAPESHAGEARILNVTYGAEGHRPGDLLNLAVVEKGLSVPVRRGENGGRTLRHDNVVRAFATVTLDAGGRGTARIQVPEDVRMNKADLIAYVQDPGNLHVLGARRAPVPSGTK